MAKKIFLLIFSGIMMTGLTAQNLTWKKHQKLAEDLLEQGNYYEAAENFEAAWKKKQNRTELIFQAGEAYYTVRDYRKAAEAYQSVKDENDKYPLVGLKYARSLKQDGQYDKAMEAFRSFLDSYSGSGKAILEEIIKTEIQGAELGLQLPKEANRDVEIKHLSAGVNSNDMEFAPFPGPGDQLYFSSNMGGKARIYTSRLSGAAYAKAETPGNFPVIQNGHYANGSLSPNGERFYFTICNADQPWDELKTRCEIFYLTQSGTGWSEPQRLPDYINMKGVTATNPSVAHINGQEILYYASNREGGRGGMDLWYTVRDLGLNNNDFTFPVNLGPTVNTLGDEITPYYNAQEGNLYFASNGQVSIGGFDVFLTQGEEVNWSVPQNLGIPINSSADDYGYVKSGSGTNGFFASNRVYGGEKNNTRHSDIFGFSIGGKRITLKGNVYDRESGELLPNVTVSLYQTFQDGTENFLISKDFTSGSYLFELLPNRTFRVEIKRNGYIPGTYQFTTDDPNALTYGQPIFLTSGAETVNPNRPIDPVNPPDPGFDDPAPTPNYGNPDPGATYTSRGIGPKDNLEYVTNAPKQNGIYYKIQLAALSRFDPNNFASVSGMGRLDTEELVNRGLTRVLVGDYFSEAEALSVLGQIQANGFPKAYIVKYQDGGRYGRVNF